MKTRLLGTLLALICGLLASCEPALAQPHQYEETSIVRPGGTRTFKVPGAINAYGYFWARLDTVVAGSTPIDSVTWRYCIARGTSAADTLARRALALRFFQSDAGDTLHWTDVDHVWYHGGYECLRPDENGIGYQWFDIVVTNTSGYPYRLTFSQTGVTE